MGHAPPLALCSATDPWHEANMADSRPRFRAATVFVLGAFLVGLYLVWITVAELVNMRRIEASSTIVDARVVDSRILSSVRRGDQPQVRYAFEVDGQTYVYGDPVGRDDLWATLPPEVYERAVEQGTIAVRYETSAPSNNHAVDELDRSILNRIFGGIIGGLLLIPGLLFLLGLALGRGKPGTEVGRP